ncbi:MAG: biopolymer transporter ExbD [Cyclobacteriaceae bacterium]
MNLNSKHKVQAAFSTSSMTDVVFLLLIFFMLTSSFITPSGMPVNLPTSKSSNIVLQKVSVTITNTGDYYVNDKKVAIGNLKNVLQREFAGEEGLVVLHCDKDVTMQSFVTIADIATSLEAKVSLATKPN